ncbi:DUF1146 family protein [Salisediminibacterium selenitireducens]|uniref:DUF1146 domain-containing protein n=1 Tax=Bacillus selenitireducens (strain ATCC 700615 / DSM 15326 / MLS10) TaxID=439292 RepID=D6Y0Q3_BACIE|nr:DUF1146 family protein [Salisediminibacterium selenitireducens]ADI00621.1 conserved hypothetical protein [[Bacillus] selenitireducens MLS10]
MIDQLGQQSLFNILISLMVLVIVWWSVQAIRMELFVKDPEGLRAKAFLVILTIALTYLITGFILNYLNWSQSLRFLF